MAEYNRENENPSIEPNALYIGQGASVKGDIAVPQILVVDGTVEGNINCRAIWVGPTGSIKGRVVATEADIHGKVSEMIEVKQLLIVRGTGRISGDVNYGELQVEKGAIISGTISAIDVRSGQRDPAPEQLLGKSERPALMRRIEPVSLINGTSVYTKLPATDFRAAS